MKITAFLKNTYSKKMDIVLIISILLASLSLIINPNFKLAYESISFKTIFLLFCFMLSLKSFELNNLFDFLAQKILSIFTTHLSIALAIINMTFIFSMFITNDVALIVFVPFSLILLNQIKINKILILSIQTIAANLGSSLSPFGNPQNIFIYTFYKLNLLEFLKCIFIYVFMSFLIINLIILICFKNTKIKTNLTNVKNSCSFYDYVIFAFCIAGVLGLVDFRLIFIIVCSGILFKNYKIFFKVDYALLFTFMFLFIFVGLNKDFLKEFLPFENMVFNSIFISNIMSNVPATLLLHNFTDYKDLLIGVNIGGLGTLISSMANLITFKLIKNEINRWDFIKTFSVLNVLFLIILIMVYVISN